MNDTPRTDEVLDMYYHARGTMLAKLAKELERELEAAKAENEAMRSAVNDADSALRKCLNHLLMQPAFARNRSDIEREAEIMESVHVALGKLQPFLKP